MGRQTANFVILCVALADVLSLSKAVAATTDHHRLPNPRIVEHPKDGYLAKNEPATLICRAEGTPKPVITWYRNNERVETFDDNPSSHRMILDDGNLFFLRVIHSKQDKPDVGIYYCNATNIHGSAVSHNAELKIAVLSKEFRESPQDATVAVGEDVTLHCRPPKGEPEPHVLWRKGGEVLQIGSGNNHLAILNNGDLVIKSAQRKEDAGQYTCLATNMAGDRESPVANLNVLEKPSFKRFPMDISVPEGRTIEFSCNVVGDQPLKVQWKKDGGYIKHGRMRVLRDRALRIEMVEASDAGTYICVATNEVGTAEAVARLSVQSPPSFVVRPEDAVVGVSRTVTLQCVVTGNPPPTVYWSKKGSKTTRQEKSLMFPNFAEGRYFVASDGTLRITNVQLEDSGEYECEGLNGLGTATATVTVEVRADSDINLPENDPRPPPIIRIGPQNQTLPTSSVGLLQCDVTGDPTPKIGWYKNGNPLPQDPRIMQLTTGTLQISDLRVSDSGQYTCKATSVTGETTWNAHLTVVTSGQPTRKRVIHFPGSPSKPMISDISATSLRLTWQPPRNPGDSPVTSYIIEHYSHQTGAGWVRSTAPIRSETYVIKNLIPETTYIFLIRGVNAQGEGNPSDLSDSVTTKSLKTSFISPINTYPRDEVRRRFKEKNLLEMEKLQTINSSAIKVFWSVNNNKDIMDVIERFEVRYTKFFGDEYQQRGETMSQSVNRLYRSCMLTNLESYTMYQVCVEAYNGNLHTECSNSFRLQTDESVPTASPDNIIIHKESDSSVNVQWLPPVKEKRNGNIQGYEVSCVSSDSKDNCSVSTNGSTNSVIIKRLRAGMTYNVKVAARTRKGIGPYSKAYVVGPEQPSIMKEPWFIGMLIGTIGGTLWVALCIFSIWLCRKRKNKKKMTQNGMYSIPMHHKTDEVRNCSTFYRNGYGNKDAHVCMSGSLSPEVSNLLDKDLEMQDQNVYNIPQMKTFYMRQDPVAPYATTTLINAGNPGQSHGMDHMFRPIPQNSGSGDSYCKHDQSSGESNTDNSRPNTGCLHEHCDHMQSPTSDSGSHTTDENGLLIKRDNKKLQNKPLQPKQAMVNWAEFLPPPPEHPPPSEMGNCSDSPANSIQYAEVNPNRNSANRSPVSPGSKISSCSCPVPHNMTPVSAYIPAYSDTGCARCYSPKYYDSLPYPQQQYNILQRAQSPQNSWGQRTIACSHPARGTPVDYRSCGNRSCHSDHEHGPLPSLNSYKINQPPHHEIGDCRFISDNERGGNSYPTNNMCSGNYHGPNGTCMDQACQSSLPSLASECIHSPMYPARLEISDSGQHLNIAVDGYNRNTDSPISEGGHDYVGESGSESEPEGKALPTYEECQGKGNALPSYEECQGEGQGQVDDDDDEAGSNVSGSELALWASVTDQSNTDCSSLRSSAASSSDGSFLTEADFASAVAKAAELSGLTVVGTTVTDPNSGKQAKRQRRHHRPARPSSPYSTDSNYSAVVHKPYPKSQRKKQLMEQGKWSGRRPEQSGIPPQHSQRPMLPPGVDDIPSYNKPNFPSPTPPKMSRQKPLSPTYMPNISESPSTSSSGMNIGSLVKESNVPVV